MDNFEFEANEIEELLRSAGEYVQPSDDLLPAVLEQARLARAEWRVQNWVWFVMFNIALCILLVGHLRLEPSRDFEIMGAPSSIAQQENPGWHAVDRFTALRRRQAAVLPSPK
ncbi:hypothetical protein [Anatilimnocola floriformis]|uniref:hypothetical protein n=1 Tax=Anatilimnocola floriformis TaxID=2948575 RepID=UPI0020C2A149|nr:hypothetical protein [Anatilimnocola floriformis]